MHRDDVAVELFADRFLREAAGRWTDLATGAAVSIAVESWSCRRERGELREECSPLDAMRALGETTPTLVDCGRVATDLWFEARAESMSGAVLTEAQADAVRARAARVGAVAEVSSHGIRIVRAASSMAGAELVLGSEIGARLRRMGIVPLRTDVHLPLESIGAIGRRHLALICYDEAGESSAAEWIRRLSVQTLRSHVLIDLRPAGTRSRRLADAVRATEHARERAPWQSVRAGGIADRQFGRAMSCVKRGRFLAGERWLRASIESGRRRGDEEVQARAGRQLVERLITREDWPAATRLVMDQLGRFQRWHARVETCDVAGRVLIAAGDLRRAERLLDAVSAEGSVLGQVLPTSVRLRKAQVRFWQGRFEESRDALGAPEPGSSDVALWAVLIAWACGEVAPSAVVALVPGAEAEGAIGEPLARACRVEALLADGRRDEALEALGPRIVRSSAARLDVALTDWLRARCAGDVAAGTSARQFIQRSGADGIARWGLGRKGMHLLHAIPALLHIVHDAEDDIGMLAQGVAWIRHHAGADAAAILTLEGDRIVAGSAFTVQDLEDELVRDAIRAERPRAVASHGGVVVAAPVVLAGATIGLVVARGAAEIAGTLTEAAAAVASLSAPALRARLDALGQAEVGRTLVSEILGRSPAIQALRESIARAAATSFPVLIEGESGTGKELVARAVHRLSARRDRRFCAINCAALTDELVEAELFGHTRGAFTGAVAPRAGLFEEAHHGTLFLDEIGELSARAQAKLLRVLQEREIRRVGDNVSRPVDVRIVAATNRMLTEASGDGLFRDDLRFRLAVVRFRMPALRERLEDVPLLAEAFWRQATAEVRKRVLLGPDAIVALCRHSWPGNVRELQNAMAALAVVAPSRGRVTSRHVQQILAGDAVPPDAVGLSLDAARRSLERRLVAAALVRHAGRRTEAARELGLSRQGLIKAIKRLGVDAGPDARGVA